LTAGAVDLGQKDALPVAVPAGSNVVVDTGERILGKPRG